MLLLLLLFITEYCVHFRLLQSESKDIHALARSLLCKFFISIFISSKINNVREDFCLQFIHRYFSCINHCLASGRASMRNENVLTRGNATTRASVRAAKRHFSTNFLLVLIRFFSLFCFPSQQCISKMKSHENRRCLLAMISLHEHPKYQLEVP